MTGVSTPASCPSLESRNKQTVRDFTQAVNRRDWKRVRELLLPDFVRHSHAGGHPPVMSSEDFVRFIQAEYVTFPDAEETITRLLAEGECVAAYHEFRGTQSGPMGPFPPTGRVMNSAYVAIYRVQDGRIAEAWAEWDNLAGLIQLGHYSPAQDQQTPLLAQKTAAP